jgi:hypothetical protein
LTERLQHHPRKLFHPRQIEHGDVVTVKTIHRQRSFVKFSSCRQASPVGALVVAGSWDLTINVSRQAQLEPTALSVELMLLPALWTLEP